MPGVLERGEHAGRGGGFGESFEMLLMLVAVVELRAEETLWGGRCVG